jgi:pilus assembly protein CpaC
VTKAEQTAGNSRRAQKRGRWLALAALLALAIPLGGPANAQKTIQITGAERTVTLSVPIGKSQDVRTASSFIDISVGDPEVADVNPLTDHAISILGKKIGTTRVTVYGPGKSLVGIFDIEVSYDISRLTNELRRRFPGSRIRGASVNGRIMLTGEAVDAAQLDQAVNIARQFGPDVINAVAVMSPQQVMLEVRFVEISRQASRELGFQWNRLGQQSISNVGNRVPAGNLPQGGTNSAGVISGAPPFAFAIARMVSNGWVMDAAINALEQQGVARSLAEPNLVALSGDTASFLAGGEYPIPVSGSLGSISVEYKKYGVGLAFTPTVLGGGLINLKIEPEVSEIDTNHTILVATNIAVPALIVRRAATTIELRDGQSFAIGGLLQNTSKNQVEQVPWLGSVPILGTLLSSKSYQKIETDLVIIVTPRLVRPARPGDVLKTPADVTKPPADTDFFLMSKNEVAREGPKQPIPTLAATTTVSAQATVAVPPSGHMLELPQGDPNAAIH